MQTAPRKRRPRIAIVTRSVQARGPVGVIASGSDRFDFVVVSRDLDPELRPLVEWHRVGGPATKSRRAWAHFFLRAGWVLRRIDADLIHTVGPAPMVPNRVDLTTVIFCQAEFQEALERDHRVKIDLGWRAMRRAIVATERWVYGGGRARALAVQSPASKRSLERHFPGAEVTLTPRGIDVQRFVPDRRARAALRAAESLAEDEVVALFVGQKSGAKGLDIAIEALAEAVGAGRGPSRLWVLGDGPRPSGLAERLGVGERVRYMGYRPDIERYYQAADLLVLPTLYETFCKAAYEAAACELPVVAPRVGAAPELVGEREAGILVERTPASVAAALRELTADPALRARMGREGRRRSVSHTGERYVTSVLELYERLLADSPSAATAA